MADSDIVDVPPPPETTDTPASPNADNSANPQTEGNNPPAPPAEAPPAPPPGDIGNPAPSGDIVNVGAPEEKAPETPAEPGTNIDTPFKQRIAQARLQGYTWDQINDFVGKKVSAAREAGFNDDQIAQYMGISKPDLEQLDKITTARMNALAATKGVKTNNIGQGILDGFAQDSTAAIVIPDSMKPQDVPPEQQGFMYRLGRQLGMSAPDIAAMSAGGAVGAVAGGGVADWITIPAGAAIGYFFSDDIRRAYAEGKVNTGVDGKDFGSRMIDNAGPAALDTAIQTASGGAGKLAGAGIAAAGGGKALQFLGQEGTALASMTAANAVVQGKLPTFEEVLDNAISVAVFHAGGKAADVTSAAVGKAYNALWRNWAATGQPIGNIAASATGGPPLGQNPPPGTPQAPPFGQKVQQIVIPTAGPAGDVTPKAMNNAFYNLDANARADDLVMRSILSTLPAEMKNPTPGYNSLAEKFVHFNDRPGEVQLTAHEKELWDLHGAPLVETRAKLVKEAADAGYMTPTEGLKYGEPGFQKRIRLGEVDQEGRLVRNAALRERGLTDTLQNNPAVGGGQGFGAKASTAKEETFHTLVDRKTGERTVISEVPGGFNKEGGELHIFRNGEQLEEHLPGNAFKYIPEGEQEPGEAQPERTTIDRPKNAKIAEKDTILKVPGDAPNPRNAKGDQLHLRVRKGQIIPPWMKEGGEVVPEKPEGMGPGEKSPAHYVYGDIKPGNVFMLTSKDPELNGRMYDIERSHIDELEQHTRQRYVKDFFAVMGDDITSLQRMIRERRYVDDLKASPSWRQMAIQTDDPNGAPKGWKPINHPMFQGWRVEPRIAEAINDAVKGGPAAFQDSDVANKLRVVSKLVTGAMFANPLSIYVHGKNILNLAIHARGWDNLFSRPHWFDPEVADQMRMVESSLRGIGEVNSLGEDYIKLLRAGVPMMMAGTSRDDILHFTAQKMGTDLARSDDPEVNKFWKAVGLEAVPERAGQWSNWITRELWRVQDHLTLSRYYELLAKGRSEDEAIEELKKFVPSYRINSRILDQRWISEILGDTNLTLFGRWAVSKATFIANNVKDMMPGATRQQRFDAIGRLATGVVMTTAVQWLVNQAAQWITGNKDASFNLGGITEDVAKAREAIPPVLHHPTLTNFVSLLSKYIYPAPGWHEGLEQAMNLDFYTGKPISAGGAVQDWAEHISHATRTLFNPLGVLAGYKSWGDFAKQSVGFHDPSKGAKYYHNQAYTGDTKLGKSMAKHDPEWMRSLYGAPK